MSNYKARGFSYNPRRPATSEFYRLCDHFDWDRELAHSHFKDALTQQFNANYETNSEDLDAWQNLCIRLRIYPVPNSLEDCRRVVVNLVDLVDNFNKYITHFECVQDLSEYTIDSGKYFPKDNAHAGDLLKYLLRQILNPPSERQDSKRGGKKRNRRH